MKKQVFEKTLNWILEEIFGFPLNITLEEAREKLAFDVELPQRVTDSLTKKPLWVVDQGEKFISESSVMKRVKKDDYLFQRQDLSGFNDVIKRWKSINALLGEKLTDSSDVLESDNIFESTAVYRSGYIFQSKYIIFSYGLEKSEYCVASKQNTATQFSIRAFSSEKCVNCFEVFYSSQVRNSLFIHNSADLSDCLFCSNLRSKRFCIANTQYEESQYKKMKAKILKEVAKRIKEKKLEPLLVGR